MTNGSNAFAVAIGFTLMVYVLIGLAPLLFGHADNTGSVDNQVTTLSTTLIGLFHPLDHPVRSILALAAGGLVVYRQTSD